MAELNQHDEIAGGVDRGAFYAVMSAMASRDPKRVALAEGDAFTALQSIGSMLNVVADYLYLRAQNPEGVLYATESEIADAVYSLSDLTACVHSSLEAGSVRISVSGEVIPGAAQRGCPLYLRCSMPDLMR